MFTCGNDGCYKRVVYDINWNNYRDDGSLTEDAPSVSSCNRLSCMIEVCQNTTLGLPDEVCFSRNIGKAEQGNILPKLIKILRKKIKPFPS